MISPRPYPSLWTPPPSAHGTPSWERVWGLGTLRRSMGPTQDAHASPGPRERDRRIVIASNRGPVAFERDEDGAVVMKRGQGGLVTALTGALNLFGGLWVASAMSEEDRVQAGRGRLPATVDEGAPHYDVRYLAFDDRTYDG